MWVRIYWDSEKLKKGDVEDVKTLKEAKEKIKNKFFTKIYFEKKWASPEPPGEEFLFAFESDTGIPLAAIGQYPPGGRKTFAKE